MLDIYFGNNTDEVRQKALARAHEILMGGREALRITTDTYEEGLLTELAQSTPLFGGTEVVLLDTLSENALFYEALLANLAILKESPHHFIVIETACKAEDKKTFSKIANQCCECKVEEEKLKIFALSDALAARDKKTLWVHLATLLQEGVPIEEIVGILFWQLKTIRLAEKTASAEEAGLKPFVYQKAKRALAKFKKGEVEELSDKLVTLYHNGHKGKGDMGIALEQWVLRL